MSSASKSVNITFLQKMGTFTPSIQSPDGDLYQEYQKNGEVVTVYPDFSQSQPKLYFVVISSRTADGVTTPVSMQFFFNRGLRYRSTAQANQPASSMVSSRLSDQVHRSSTGG